MEKLIVSENELNEIQLDSIVFHTEGDIYLYFDGNKSKAIKRLNNNFGLYFSNKLYTINTLIDSKDKIAMSELIMPEKLVCFDDEVVGYSMPFVVGSNLEVLLRDESINVKEKISYLKQIGNILNQMSEARKRLDGDFYLNDLHESNFLVKQDGKVVVVDLDSSYILGNYPFRSKYLSSFSPIVSFPQKYKRNESCEHFGKFIPDLNTDLYCYNMIVLNLLYSDDMISYNLSEFYEFLEYLNSTGLNKELIDAFAKLYTLDDNVNIEHLLDYIPEVYDKIREKCLIK